MSYKFPVPQELIGRPIIFCPHCQAKLAKTDDGLITTDGYQHECPALVARGVKRCDYCTGRIAWIDQWRAFDLDGKPHGPTCTAAISQRTKQMTAPRGRANNRSKR